MPAGPRMGHAWGASGLEPLTAPYPGARSRQRARGAKPLKQLLLHGLATPRAAVPAIMAYCAHASVAAWCLGALGHMGHRCVAARGRCVPSRLPRRAASGLTEIGRPLSHASPPTTPMRAHPY